MIITCNKCNSSYFVNEDLIKDSGSKVKCSKCDNVFLAYCLPAEEVETLQADNDGNLESDELDLSADEKNLESDELDFSDLDNLLDDSLKEDETEEEDKRKRKRAEATRTEAEVRIGEIFISYSRKDKEYVLELIDYLEKAGLSVWIDDRIDHGDLWWQTIVTKIRNCAAMVVVMTPESEETDWVEKEYFFANDIKKPLFPLLLKGACFPFFVNQQYHDVRDGSMPPKRFIVTIRQYGR